MRAVSSQVWRHTDRIARKVWSLNIIQGRDPSWLLSPKQHIEYEASIKAVHQRLCRSQVATNCTMDLLQKNNCTGNRSWLVSNTLPFWPQVSQSRCGSTVHPKMALQVVFPRLSPSCIWVRHYLDNFFNDPLWIARLQCLLERQGTRLCDETAVQVLSKRK